MSNGQRTMSGERPTPEPPEPLPTPEPKPQPGPEQPPQAADS